MLRFYQQSRSTVYFFKNDLHKIKGITDSLHCGLYSIKVISEESQKYGNTAKILNALMISFLYGISKCTNKVFLVEIKIKDIDYLNITV